jgi:hypothetical protein
MAVETKQNERQAGSKDSGRLMWPRSVVKKGWERVRRSREPSLEASKGICKQGATHHAHRSWRGV